MQYIDDDDGPRPKKRPYRELLERGEIAPAPMPAGRISKETMATVAQENIGLAFNRIVDIVQHGEDKAALAAAKQVIETAYPVEKDKATHELPAFTINIQYIESDGDGRPLIIDNVQALAPPGGD